VPACILSVSACASTGATNHRIRSRRRRRRRRHLLQHARQTMPRSPGSFTGWAAPVAEDYSCCIPFTAYATHLPRRIHPYHLRRDLLGAALLTTQSFSYTTAFRRRGTWQVASHRHVLVGAAASASSSLSFSPSLVIANNVPGEALRPGAQTPLRHRASRAVDASCVDRTSLVSSAASTSPPSRSSRTFLALIGCWRAFSVVVVVVVAVGEGYCIFEGKGGLFGG